MKPKPFRITFDIDDTLLPKNGRQEKHCAALRSLYNALRQAKNVELHCVSGRTETSRPHTLIQLHEVGIKLASGRLHLKPNADMADAEHKLAMAQRLQPALVIDNSEVCRGFLEKAGFTYLKVTMAG